MGRVTIRLTDSEERILRAAATRQGTTLAGFCRHQILFGQDGANATETNAEMLERIDEVTDRIEAFGMLLAELKTALSQHDADEVERLKKAVNFITQKG